MTHLIYCRYVGCGKAQPLTARKLAYCPECGRKARWRDANWTPIGPHGWDLSETEVAILRVNKIKPD